MSESKLIYLFVCEDKAVFMDSNNRLVLKTNTEVIKENAGGLVKKRSISSYNLLLNKEVAIGVCDEVVYPESRGFRLSNGSYIVLSSANCNAFEPCNRHFSSSKRNVLRGSASECSHGLGILHVKSGTVIGYSPFYSFTDLRVRDAFGSASGSDVVVNFSSCCSNIDGDYNSYREEITDWVVTVSSKSITMNGNCGRKENRVNILVEQNQLYALLSLKYKIGSSDIINSSQGKLSDFSRLVRAFCDVDEEDRAYRPAKNKSESIAKKIFGYLPIKESYGSWYTHIVTPIKVYDARCVGEMSCNEITNLLTHITESAHWGYCSSRNVPSIPNSTVFVCDIENSMCMVYSEASNFSRVAFTDFLPGLCNVVKGNKLAILNIPDLAINYYNGKRKYALHAGNELRIYVSKCQVSEGILVPMVTLLPKKFYTDSSRRRTLDLEESIYADDVYAMYHYMANCGCAVNWLTQYKAVLEGDKVSLYEISAKYSKVIGTVEDSDKGTPIYVIKRIMMDYGISCMTFKLYFYNGKYSAVADIGSASEKRIPDGWFSHCLTPEIIMKEWK
jgi:hypothetical protein